MTQPSDASDLVSKTIEKGRKRLDELAANANQAQQTLLNSRRAGLEQAASLIRLQAEAAGSNPSADLAPAVPARPVLYTHERLVEFGVGDLVKALGSEYEIYNHRRAPRIPNGDLLLMSRAVSATGQRMHPEAGNEIIVEYDVPQDAWFFRDNNYPYIPYAVYMEIALQPCGLLSAHLGTSLQFPEQDYYFRNLDGEARIVRLLDLRGKTITTRATLHRPMVSGNQIIHKFDFQLSVEGQAVFEGNSVFGFFPPESMASQLGRDGGQETLPLFEKAGRGLLEGKLFTLPDNRFLQASVDRPYYRLPSGHFSLLKEIYLSPKGGRSGLGYIYANQPVNKSDWFYACHFHQDPVMPGSLGVEAILEAMQAFALNQDLGRDLKNPRFDLIPGNNMSWKYRGQILPNASMMKLEVHLTRLERSASQVLIMGDASLWADRIRIYEIKTQAFAWWKDER